MSAYPEGAEIDFNVSDDDELDFSVLDNLTTPVVAAARISVPPTSGDLSNLPSPPSFGDFDDGDTIDPLVPELDVDDDELEAILGRANSPVGDEEDLPSMPTELEDLEPAMVAPSALAPRTDGNASISPIEKRRYTSPPVLK